MANTVAGLVHELEDRRRACLKQDEKLKAKGRKKVQKSYEQLEKEAKIAKWNTAKVFTKTSGFNNRKLRMLQGVPGN